MNTKKPMDETFIDTIRSVGHDTPSPDFTQAVMNEILADTDGKTVANHELKLILQEGPIESPSLAFTNNVIRRITLRGPVTTHKPILTRRAWFGAATMAIFTLFVLIVTDTADETSAVSAALDHAFYRLYGFIRELPHVYVLTIASASVLLLLDHLLSDKFVRSERTPSS